MIRSLLLTAIAGLFLLGATPTVFSPIAAPSGARLQDPTITRDGGTMYLTISSRTRNVIVMLHRDAAGTWKLAGTAPFSGTWRDLEEVLTPDDRAMIFGSNRPLPGTTKPLDAFFGGQYRPRAGGNLWIVRRTTEGWGTPQPLPAGVNANTSVFSPAIAADGTLYFMRATGRKGSFHLFVSLPPYAQATRAPFASATAAEFDPTVSADGATVIFSSTRAPLPKGTSHLFVAFRHGSTWTTPRDLGPAINGITPHNIEARLLPAQLCWNSTMTMNCTGWPPKV
jgi:hypothetical protein